MDAPRGRSVVVGTEGEGSFARGGFSTLASDKQSIKAADTAGRDNAARGRRRGEQANVKQSFSAVPPTISHSGVLSRKQAVSNPSY